MSKNQVGFSLLELIIAVTIIAILAAIAYPAYFNHIHKTRCALAKAALVDLAARLERYHALTHSYQGATLSALDFNAAAYPAYQFSLAVAQANYYQIQALADNPGQQEKVCQRLTLDSLGQW